MSRRRALRGVLHQLGRDLARLPRSLLVNVVAASTLTPRLLRASIYRLAGIETATLNVYPGCFFGDGRVALGRGTHVNHGCFFDSFAPIEIGSRCNLGMEVMLCTSTHEIGSEDRRAGRATGKPIRIEDGCWIGARAVILPGATIGRGCVVAAGSVVSGSCEPGCLYAGVPARRVRDLDARPG